MGSYVDTYIRFSAEFPGMIVKNTVAPTPVFSFYRSIVRCHVNEDVGENGNLIRITRSKKETPVFKEIGTIAGNQCCKGTLITQ
jgi:hypothetical protein